MLHLLVTVESITNVRYIIIDLGLKIHNTYENIKNPQSKILHIKTHKEVWIKKEMKWHCWWGRTHMHDNLEFLDLIKNSSWSKPTKKLKSTLFRVALLIRWDMDCVHECVAYWA